MSDDRLRDCDPDNGEQTRRDLTPAAQRALAEAAVRRAEAHAAQAAQETGGPAGAEPTRFGDWERRGLAVDF